MKLPSLSSDELIRALKRAGFVYAPRRGKGSHVALYMDTPAGRRLVIVPRREAIPRGTLRAIIEQAGMSREEFIRLLRG